MGSDLQELYRRACERFGEHVHAIRDDQWGSGTPCTEWDVKALVGHLITEVAWVPPLVGGRPAGRLSPSVSRRFRPVSRTGSERLLSSVASACGTGA